MCGVSEDNDQFVDTNVGRGRRISIDIEDINQYRPQSIDMKISIDAETGGQIDLIRRYQLIQQYNRLDTEISFNRLDTEISIDIEILFDTEIVYEQR